jgi:hypothetical protein
MDLSTMGVEIGKVLVYGFGSGFMVGMCILSMRSVVYKLYTFYK